ncbi:hypothetical protein FACS189493_3920 [Spirochaetia bacterium]|nr:hypothetical protein FACS189493_3920 [Spirochaetia bacterium]
MVDLDEERGILTRKLSEQYSQNSITMEEYERILEYINKLETRKEISIIEKIIQETGAGHNELTPAQNNEPMIPPAKGAHVALFSWRSSNVVSQNGYGGKYISLFGANRITIDNLPKGKTVIDVNSIFGLTEILIPKNIKIINKTVPVFAGVFAPGDANNEDEGLAELYIRGKAVFGNITIKRI